jgi:DNA invertase Pin-like site-specific DNA recombinase
MDRIINVAGYVKLAKLWEKRAAQAVRYHNDYYRKKFADVNKYSLVGVYIDITGEKEIYKRDEMLRLLKDCSEGKVDCIATQTRAYLAANTKEFCYLIYFLHTLNKPIDILTEDEEYNIDTATNYDKQKEALEKMAEDYINLNPNDYYEWSLNVIRGIGELNG